MEIAYCDNAPCSVVAVSTALGKETWPTFQQNRQMRSDGYMPLETMNKFVRDNLHVRKRITYKRGERPKLRELPQILADKFPLMQERKAVVCVLGHYLYLAGDVSYSLFDNVDDDVVSVWVLEESNG